jgi:hypothetical protein
MDFVDNIFSDVRKITNKAIAYSQAKMEQRQGLPGLRGFKDLPYEDQRALYMKNKDLFAKYNNNIDDIDRVYRNHQFVKALGIDTFKAVQDPAVRDQMYRTKYISDLVTRLYSNEDPETGKTDPNIGLGNEWSKYSRMSVDAWEKVLRSGFLNNQEFEDEWNKYEKGREATKNEDLNRINYGMAGLAYEPQVKKENRVEDWDTPFKTKIGGYGLSGEAAKEYERKINRNILDKIYGDDVDRWADNLEPAVKQEYAKFVAENHSDDEVKQMFFNEIEPDFKHGK